MTTAMNVGDAASVPAPADAALGKIGLPAPLPELASQHWDVIVVGAGHNGLTCAAYLARAGKRVLVLEARERVGGACTLQELWGSVKISPCAYLVGLLHPLVVDELRLREHGFAWTPATNGLFVPFDDGSSVQLWEDEEACEAEIRRFAPGSVAGWRAMQGVMGRLREALRPAGERDLWIGEPPTREELEERIGHDADLRGLLFDWSMAEFAERYLEDERLQLAYLGQGVIGTNASPFDPGTAFIHFHHSSGGLDGYTGVWGYVHGGMGRVSFLLCDIARELGATVAAGVPVARILPGEGVELADGTQFRAPIVVSNADPRVTLGLLGSEADSAWRAQVEAVPITGCTVKCNMLLRELPSFTARPGTNEPHHAGQINTPLSKQGWRDGFAAARRGELPEQLWTELYFQTVHDPSVAPAGLHTMSVFAQYVPYTFATGEWETRRDDVKQLAIATLGRYVSNFPEAIVDVEVLGPPDIEREVGLTGGHIFQGECLPPYMWDQRLRSRTPMPGVYLCGACTHPGGSVIAMNGRNAAMAVLRDLSDA
ncbi:MAG TPA: NAD(P)/FAD-dependent oxidoreductase [Ktedonobacterales bacterium]|nr:NAD(P)/FAD-dependent oxidoreductase [Ktedonobacterales bacterium]